MVDIKANFILLFDDDSSGKSSEFLKLLKSWSNRIRVGSETDSGIEVGFLIKGHEPSHHYVPFYLNSGRVPIEKVSVLYFYSDLMDDAHISELELFHDVFLTACKSLKPIYGSAEATIDRPHRPVMDQAEYYRNPYLFCVEPPLFNGEFDPKVFYSFLQDRGLASKLTEVESVMSRSELVEIIRRNVEKVVVNDDGGVGVLKNKIPQACYPRYFIRRELRRRGVQLSEGVAERYAREFGIK